MYPTTITVRPGDPRTLILSIKMNIAGGDYGFDGLVVEDDISAVELVARQIINHTLNPGNTMYGTLAEPVSWRFK